MTIRFFFFPICVSCTITYLFLLLMHVSSLYRCTAFGVYPSVAVNIIWSFFFFFTTPQIIQFTNKRHKTLIFIISLKQITILYAILFTFLLITPRYPLPSSTWLAPIPNRLVLMAMYLRTTFPMATSSFFLLSLVPPCGPCLRPQAW